MRHNAILLASLLMLSTIPMLYFTSENALGDSNWADVSVSADSYHVIDLGTIDAGKELEIDYSANDNIDVLLMNSNQYSAWQTGGSTHINSGSDYDDSGDDYVYTTDTSQQYYLVLDNSDQNPEGADSTGSTVTVSGDVTVVDANPGTIKTRAWAESSSYVEIVTSTIETGKVLSIDVSCDIGLTSSDDLDFLLMDSIQALTLGGSSWSWNPHASFEDTCSHDWEYETGKDSRWSLVIDNSDQARTDGLDNGIMVDVEIDTRSLIPAVEVTDTSRMIESGDYYRVDIGLLPANGVIDIDFAFWSHGATAMLLDDLDILVMESSEANKYENGNDADILGHASMLDAGSQSWSYQFPNAGLYSIIFDNTDEPSGGAGDGSDIQVEIGVTSLTIPSLFGNLWTGWHQSRHYADEGDIMALDLGTLNSGDDVYYYIDGNNEGGSLWSAREYDILFMTKANYDLYVNDTAFSVISDGTNYEQGELLPSIENMSISSNTDYMLVLDAKDGPDSNSADANGDWIWEFIVLSTGGSISNLHAQDNHYEDWISVGTISPPDSDGDGVRNGLDECPSTQSGTSVDSSGCAASQLDDDGDGVTNDMDQCPDTQDGDEVDSTGCTILPDSDNDGVEDSADQCPDTPAGESVDSTGCSASQRDSDNDGVNDADDQCPGHDDNVDVDNDGTPDGCDSLIDSDGDGVADSQDQCPGHDDNADSDNDGTPDGCDNDIYTPLPSFSIIDRLEYRGLIEHHGLKNSSDGSSWDIYQIELGPTGDLTVHFDALNSSDADATDGTNGIKTYIWKVFLDNPWDQPGTAPQGGKTTEISSMVSHSFTHRFQNITVDSNTGFEGSLIRIELTVIDQADKESLQSDKYKMYFRVVDDGYGDDEPVVDFTSPENGSSQTDDTLYVNGSIVSGSENGDVMIEVALEEDTLNLLPSQKFPLKVAGEYDSTVQLADGAEFSLTLDIAYLYNENGSTQTIWIKITEGDGSRWTIYQSIDINLAPLNPSVDSDGDGVEDSQDQCDGHNDNSDSDGDGIPDGCDSTDDSTPSEPDENNGSGENVPDTPVTDDSNSDGNSNEESQNKSVSMPLLIGIGVGVIGLLVVVVVAVLMLRGGNKPPEQPMRGLL